MAMSHGQAMYHPPMKDFPPSTLPAGATSWLEIDLETLAGNIAAFRRQLAPGTRLAAVVKANAYGHGADLVAPRALEAGAQMLAVINLAEGIELRHIVGDSVPIMVLGFIPPGDAGAIVEHDLQPTIFDRASLATLAAEARRMGRPARVHLKLETGTHRQGLEGKALIELAREVRTTEGLVLAGASTHFADIEDTTDHRFAKGQIERFEELLGMLEKELGGRPPLCHTACSAAAILFPETHMDLVRVGIGLYGLWPSRETLVSARERGLSDFELQPVMSWKTVLAQVKPVPTGAYVGYGRTWRATRPSRIAVLPVGYFEGYPRALSGRAHVLIQGRRAPVVGRVCMNMTMVDVTDIPGVQSGDVAVLLGRSGDEQVSAEKLASWAGTIHYEIVSRIHPSLPRRSARQS